MAKNMMPEGGRTIIGWVMVGGIIALILLILAILFGNLSGNVGFSSDSEVISVRTITLNETESKNVTDLTGKINPSLSGMTIANATDGVIIDSANYTINGGNISAVAGTEYNGVGVNVSGTLLYDSSGQIDTDNIIHNYTRSATNVGKQLPVTGTIVGIALLLLVLLFILGFAVSRLLKMSGGESVGSGRIGGSSRFRGSSSAELG